MKLIAKRLEEGTDLKTAIEGLVHEHQLTSATIISALGSLNKLTVRMAGAMPDNQDIRKLDGPFEIVSLTGNLGPQRSHLHISVADKTAQVIGGHLKEGSIVHTTVEVVLILDETVTFGEKLDPKTGFGELNIQ